MDPLSITASALGLAAHVLKTAVLVKEAIGQLRDAPDIASDIEHDITITQAALRQVEAALGHDPQAIWRFGLDDIFDVSVKGCLETLQRIDEEFKSFFGRDDWHARLGIWWNGGELRRLVGRLEAKKGSLMLLVQALSLRSVQEMQVLLQQNRATLDIARLGLEAMVPSYPSYKDKDFDTVASEIASDDSVLGDRDSVISDTRFPFDEICFGSRAYQRAVARVSSKTVKTEVSMLARDTHLASVAEADAETESQASGETVAAAAPAAPATVENAIHEAVCLKLQEAEARIQALEERIRQEAAEKGRNGPGDRLKDESSRKRVSFNEAVRVGSSVSRPMDINHNGHGHETEDEPEQIANHRAKKDRRYRSGAQRDEPDAFLISTAKKKTDESVPDLNTSARRVLLGGDNIKKSQTSLLLEYFENGPGKANGDVRRPSVRVRVTPTAKRQTGSCEKGITVTRRRPLHSDKDCKPSEISAMPPDSFFDKSAPSTGRIKRDPNRVGVVNKDGTATDGGIKYKRPKERRTKSRSSSLTENALREGRARTSRARLAVLEDGDVPPGEAHPSRPRYPATSAINNPKLLETVEDAIRRLILPELMAVKREQKEKAQLKASKLEVTTGEVEQDTAKYADQLPDSRDHIPEVPVKAL